MKIRKIACPQGLVRQHSKKFIDTWSENRRWQRIKFTGCLRSLFNYFQDIIRSQNVRISEEDLADFMQLNSEWRQLCHIMNLSLMILLFSSKNSQTCPRDPCDSYAVAALEPGYHSKVYQWHEQSQVQRTWTALMSIYYSFYEHVPGQLMAKRQFAKS